jgi:hypothetical protein
MVLAAPPAPVSRGSNVAEATPATTEAPAWLRASPWQLCHATGQVIFGHLIFLSDKLVWDGKQIIWRWDYDKTGLTISHLDYAPFFQFIRRRNADQSMILDGRILAGDAAFDLQLSPSPRVPPLGNPNRDLNASIVLGNHSKTLLVIFNSAHRPYEGREYGPQWRWEFYDLPETTGIDHVRLAEGNQPLHWYTNKTRRILAMLEGIINSGYAQVIFCGISSGGYASLLFAELLSRKFPGVMFRTSTINPQTAHAPEHRNNVAAMDVFCPSLITDEALAARDCETTEIAALVQSRAGDANIAHSVYYDGANPAENYYTGLIAHLPGFSLRPQMFGIGHMSACIALYERRLVQIEVEQTARAFEMAGQA